MGEEQVFHPATFIPDDSSQDGRSVSPGEGRGALTLPTTPAPTHQATEGATLWVLFVLRHPSSFSSLMRATHVAAENLELMEKHEEEN